MHSEEIEDPTCQFPSLEKRASGSDSRVQGRDCQGRTQAERTTSGLRGLHHPEMGTAIVVATVPIGPVCKGAGVLEKQGIT